jgi:RNA polymerase-binding transcription factor DksA
MPKVKTLRGERARLLRQLLGRYAMELSARKQDLRGLSADSVDAVEDAESRMVREWRGLGAAMASISSRTVQMIEVSLRRLQAGTYGLCSDCEQPIAKERLRALPFADACRDCQERRDQASGTWSWPAPASASPRAQA